MLNYPPKILLAFGETFGDNDKEFRSWLLENGYKELAALSSGIKSDCMVKQTRFEDICSYCGKNQSLS